MTTIEQARFTAEQRRDLEAAYRQQIGSIKALARLLGYPCPIATRAERRATVPTIEASQSSYCETSEVMVK